MGSGKKDHGGAGLFLKARRVGIIGMTIKETLKIWDAGPNSVFDLQEGLGACSLFELRSLLHLKIWLPSGNDCRQFFSGHLFFCILCLGFFFFPGFPVIYGTKNEMVEKNTTQS